MMIFADINTSIEPLRREIEELKTAEQEATADLEEAENKIFELTK
jgi:prefoldin subunit 5